MSGGLKNSFLGQSGFVWWIGVVENRKDPLNLGRCQIRIFGWHTDNLQLIPSADLPWAQAVLPSNNSEVFATPKEGQYVLGFFFDGASGQFPAYLGVLPGIPKTAALQQDVPQAGFRDIRTIEELKQAPAPPEAIIPSADGSGTTITDQPAKRFPSVAGYPSTPPSSANNPDNPPEQIVNRIKNAIKNIAGPENTNLANEISAAATSAQQAIDSASANLADLKTKASAAASEISSKLSGLVDSIKPTEYQVILEEGVAKINIEGLSVPFNQVNTIADNLKTQLASLQDQLKQLLSN